MPLSQDHKRAFDGDKGPNTGGMGAYTGLPFITEEDRVFAQKSILEATAKAMVAEGCPLSGVLYGGLMKTPDGIKVIEFNARFGDPETEVVLPLLESDIYDIFEAVATGRKAAEPVWRNAVTLGVVLASKGYPGSYEKGAEILGTEQVDAKLYHMGTKLTPTRIYVKQVLDVIRQCDVHGVAHITGGGFDENIPRVLRDGQGLEIREGSWEILPVFQMLEKWGGVPHREMFNIFNMGIGMVLVLDAAEADKAISILASHGEKASVIGKVTDRPGVNIILK